MTGGEERGEEAMYEERFICFFFIFLIEQLCDDNNNPYITSLGV
jgi:hypothetical protein